MKRKILSVSIVFTIVTMALTAGAQTFSTPAYSGAGAPSNPYTNYQTSTAFNSSLGQDSGTALGTSLGSNNGTATVPGSPALGQPSTALGQQDTTGIGQQNTTAISQQNTSAIGQPGAGTAITPGGTAIATPSGTGSAVPPSGAAGAVGQVSTNARAGTISNGFIVNNDGTVTALPGAGSTAAGNFSGTNTGAGSSIQTPGQGAPLQNQTNTQQTP